MKEIKLKRQSRWVVRSLMLLGVLLGGIFAFVFHPIEGTKADNNKDIVIQVTAEAGQQLTISKYFANAYTIDRGDNSGITTASSYSYSYSQHTYESGGTYDVTLSLKNGYTRWTFYQQERCGLVPSNCYNNGSYIKSTVTNAIVKQMPSLEWFGDSNTDPGNNFFSCFNLNGALTELPANSFNTSNIESVGNYFFSHFNDNGALTELPANSFDTSNIESAGNDFFSHFNDNGALTELPANSFDTSNIESAGNDFFGRFNYNGALTELPANSFDTSNIESAGNYFFGGFNYNGALTELPANSFDTSNIESVGYSFFGEFNCNGALTELPDGSFNTSNITSIGTYNRGTNYGFFQNFNYNGAITYLPDSFNINSIGVSEHLGYEYAFLSQNYTLNRNVSDLIAGINTPTEDKNMFSNNQPGICGVHGYRLDSVENACSDEDCGKGYHGVNNQCIGNNAGVYYGDGYIEVRNGDDVLYLADKNVGATTVYQLPEIIRKRNLVLDKRNELTQEYDWDVLLYQDELLNFSYDVLGIQFSNVDDLESYLDSDNPLSYIVNYAVGKLECYQTNEGCTDEEWLYIINRESGKDFDIEHMFDAWEYVNNYDPYNPIYGEYNIDSYGNYYFRGNNNGATREELGVTDDYHTNISQSAYNRGFSGGVMGEDSNNGWIEGNVQNNPCNREGEYLPTYSDWKNVLEIWANSHGYDVIHNDNGDNGTYYIGGYNGLSDFYNDLLIPNVGHVEQYKSPIKSRSLSYDNQTKRKTKLVDYLTMLFSSPVYAIDIGGYEIIFSSSIYLHMALDSGNNYGMIDGTLQYQNLSNQNYDNTIAAPVRCFIDPDYVEGAVKYTVTFDIRGGNEIIPSQVRVQGKKLKEPTIPTKDGYTFAGWYTSDGKKWNFDEDVVENEMTLYAKWRLCGVGFIVENNQCIPEGIEFNGVIKVTDGERTMYVRDRNVGVTSDAAVAFLKLDFIRDKYNDLWDYQCNNQCYSQCNSYGDCYEMCYDECYDKNFLEVVEKEIGVSYESVDDAYNLLQLEVLKGLLPEKELEAYVLISNFDTISDQCAGNIFVDPFRNVDECVHNEMIRYINETFQLDHELQNMDDVENWISEYFGMEEFNKFTLRYNNGYYNGLIDAQAFGNYYYRGNNSGVNYNDLEFEKPLDGNFSIINIDELVAKGFDGGNIGGDGLGWISGNVNPCDPEKGEYLPTPEDWKDLMEIWGNANGYSLGDESTILRNLDDYREYNYFFGESQHREFQSELLIPYGGNIYKDTNFVSVFDNAWFPLRTSQDDEGNMGVYNRNGRWGGLYYTHYKKFIDDGWNELYAMPVRCFVNLAEISDVYVVSYETNGGNIIGDVNVIGGDTVILPTPTRDNYTFDGWYTDRALTNSFASTTPVTSDLTLYAKWSVKQSTSSNGGAGGYIRKDSCPNGDYTDSYYDGKCGKRPSTSSGTNVKDKKGHNSADEVEYDSSNYNPKYSDEINQAYQYAYHYGITTKNNIKDASMNGKLTRVAMAKMLSQYAINVLGMKPDTSRQNKFADVTDNLDTKYNNGVTLAYQLGIMGINMQNNEFKPYNYVTRGEFVTALSRLLYKTSDGEYRSTARYYTNHIKKLENEGIITKVDPYMKELRGYVMLMLMRSAK